MLLQVTLTTLVLNFRLSESSHVLRDKQKRDQNLRTSLTKIVFDLTQQKCKMKQGNFIYKAHFKHRGNLKVLYKANLYSQFINLFKEQLKPLY